MSTYLATYVPTAAVAPSGIYLSTTVSSFGTFGAQVSNTFSEELGTATIVASLAVSVALLYFVPLSTSITLVCSVPILPSFVASKVSL